LASNYRTGLHVHIDVRNLEANELLTMFVYYALFEPVIFQWVGDRREGSIFCMPLYKAEGVLPQIIDAISAPAGVMKSVAAKIDRYAAFNLNSLSKFGTVEFRHMQTTFNTDRVIKWINICQSFKKYAKNNPLKPDELLMELSKNGYANTLASILGPQLSAELWNRDAAKLIEDYGLVQAQEIATLLGGSAGVVWDSVRTALGTGSNPRWSKWAEKQKENKELSKIPDNPFSDPELLRDPEMQKHAMDMLKNAIREKLSVPISQW
jgi:hypothetical protein